MSVIRTGPRRAGDTFKGRGPHDGHTVTVIAVDMPSVRFDEVIGHFDTWVECSCGEAWKYVPAEYDSQDKDTW